MKTFARPALGAVLILVLAACASSSGRPWTPPPVVETEVPASEAPASAPASGAPASEAPASEGPASEAPASEAPASGAPGSEAPASEAPGSEAPESEAPSSQAPASVVPESAAPESAAPASDAPGSPGPASPAASAPASPATSGEPAGRVIELELTAALEIKENGTKVTDIPVTPGETIVFRVTNTAGYIHNFWIGPDADLAANQVEGLPGIPDWAEPEPRELTWVVPEDVEGLFYGCTVPGHYTLMKGTFSLAQ